MFVFVKRVHKKACVFNFLNTWQDPGFNMHAYLVVSVIIIDGSNWPCNKKYANYEVVVIYVINAFIFMMFCW